MIRAALHPYPFGLGPVSFELPVEVCSALGGLDVDEINAHIFGTGAFELIPVDFRIMVRNVDPVNGVAQRQLDPIGSRLSGRSTRSARRLPPQWLR